MRMSKAIPTSNYLTLKTRAGSKIIPGNEAPPPGFSCGIIEDRTEVDSEGVMETHL